MAGGRPAILVVDDTTSLVSPWKAEIAKICNAITVVGGFEALSRIRANPDIGLVMVNVSLQRLDGQEAIIKIRSKNQNIPILVLAKPQDSRLVQSVSAYNIQEVVLIPVKVSELVEKMSKYLALEKPASDKAESGPAKPVKRSESEVLSGIKQKYYQAQSFFANGQIDETIRVYNEIINEKQLQGAHLKYVEEAYYQIGRCWIKKNDYKQAIEAFKLFITKAPKSLLTRQALLYLGNSYEMLKEPTTALNFYTKVLSLSDTDSLATQARKQIKKIKNQ